VRSLYLCYFGLRQPLVQTQVLPYLRELAADEPVGLLTFELRDAWSRSAHEATETALAAKGIAWETAVYHSRPAIPATAWDILAGAARAVRIHRRRPFRLLHARGVVAAAMARLAGRILGVPYLFDVRGRLPREYVDAGLWKEGGVLHRWAERVERRLIRSAAACVALSDAGRRQLLAIRNGRPEGTVATIPCCVDTDRFAPIAPAARFAFRQAAGLGGDRLYVCAGSLGGWYLTKELSEFWVEARRHRPAAELVVLTHSDSADLRALLAKGGAGGWRIRTASPEEMPQWLSASDVGLCFVKPAPSKAASSPTKIGEYLASGLPVIATAGVGDVDALLEGERCGALLRSLEPAAYRSALGQVDVLLGDPAAGERNRDVARRRLGLREVGIPAYRRIYDVLCPPQGAGS
jgi:glycosyltransferase involved in cell wall biosynthesis